MWLSFHLQESPQESDSTFSLGDQLGGNRVRNCLFKCLLWCLIMIVCLFIPSLCCHLGYLWIFTTELFRSFICLLGCLISTTRWLLRLIFWCSLECSPFTLNQSLKLKSHFYLHMAVKYTIWQFPSSVFGICCLKLTCISRLSCHLSSYHQAKDMLFTKSEVNLSCLFDHSVFAQFCIDKLMSSSFLFSCNWHQSIYCDPFFNCPAGMKFYIFYPGFALNIKWKGFFGPVKSLKN